MTLTQVMTNHPTQRGFNKKAFIISHTGSPGKVSSVIGGHTLLVSVLLPLSVGQPHSGTGCPQEAAALGLKNTNNFQAGGER